ncbi:rhodanese-like domain-containing protein [Alteromonas flava]|uniref:rhodanese-like domain-containing protein n=1 Tax=Alteromonas flava TaxID=2048003 RepID=UPI000C285E57|nr:rhodanese-like domain-containing protein [Alteromonas flava]
MQIQNATAQQVKQWLDDGQAVLIDVREPNEFTQAHIPGATLLPLGNISAADLPKVQENIVIYCQKGGRGNKACIKVTSESDLTVFNLEGGIEAWAAAGFPVNS